MHLPHHQQMLREHAKHGGINAVLKIIREENSAALHIEEGERETLSNRVFAHKPATSVPWRYWHTDKSVGELYARSAQASQRVSSGTSAASSNSEATDALAALA